MKEVSGGIFLNFENLLILRKEVENKIKEIKDCYDSIKKRLPIIDGTDDAYQGNDQRTFFDAFEMITDTYDINIKELEKIYKYLCDAIDSYEQTEIDTGRDIDKNEENLTV